jgi:hypothetical protein
MILILTNKKDVHPNPVIEKLGDFPFLRINTEELLTKYKISWFNENGKIHWKLTSLKNKITIHSKDVFSVWERRPEPVKYTSQKISERRVRKFCRDEATAFFRFFRYSLNDVFWLGHPLVDRIAQSRLLQQKIATSFGILCANSVFSNDPSELKSFAKKFSNVCVKSIHHDSVTFDDHYVSMGSTRTPGSDILKMDDAQLEATVNYLQEYIEKDFELRITVVCNEVFGCKLLSQELDDENGKIDWRDGLFNGLKHEVFEVPENIKSFCIQYLKAMNQNFGAFDFIVTPKGEYYFLECNSNGQWYWIELETGMDISGAIARHLIKGGW